MSDHAERSGLGLFDALYRDWYDYAWAIAKSILHSDDDASDAVQQVFMRLWAQPFSAYPRSPRPFFRTAARRQALSLIRKRKTESALKAALASTSPEVNVEPGAADDHPVLPPLVVRLPPRCQAVVALVLEGYSHSEIASRLGVRTKAVEKQMVRARRIIGAHFHEPGGRFSTTSASCLPFPCPGGGDRRSTCVIFTVIAGRASGR